MTGTLFPRNQPAVPGPGLTDLARFHVVARPVPSTGPDHAQLPGTATVAASHTIPAKIAAHATATNRYQATRLTSGDRSSA